jgi:succinyl-CoA:acetate CoA-transferase
MPLSDRVLHPGLRRKIMSAEAAAALIPAGANVGTSGFTGAGYPKAVPQALAQRIKLLHADGEDFQIGLWTGASTAPELDGALAKVHGIEMRLPYQSDPAVRKQINNGQMQYTDIHLSHVAQFVWFGFLGHLDVAVIEVAGILPDGRLIPRLRWATTRPGWTRPTPGDPGGQHQPEPGAGGHARHLLRHRAFRRTASPSRMTATGRPHRPALPALRSGQGDRRGAPDLPDRSNVFAPPDENSAAIAGHIIEFLAHEVKHGPPAEGPAAAAVGRGQRRQRRAGRPGELHSPFREPDRLHRGAAGRHAGPAALGHAELSASATAMSLSDEARLQTSTREHRFLPRAHHPAPAGNLEPPRADPPPGHHRHERMIEADIYGNVNSTHLMGTSMMNGIGGSGDFARNGYLSFFVTPSVAKNGAISCIVPMVSHVDHTEHDQTCAACRPRSARA